MAAAKRTTYVLQPPSEVDVGKNTTPLPLETSTEDRLGDLPEALQLHILTFTDLDKFEPFVRRALSERDDLAKLDTVKYNAPEISSLETLMEVFDYAVKHGVKQLEASIETVEGLTSSLPTVSISDSLTSLKLQSAWSPGPIRVPFLGPNTPFKNLIILYLHGALITDEEPFVGFPMLESLTLLNCYFRTGNRTLIEVYLHNLRLSDLTISYCNGVNKWELRTPRLRYLEYGGSDFPKHEGLPVLETLKIDFDEFNFSYMGSEVEKRRNDDLLSLLFGVPRVKSLTLFKTTVLLLYRFKDDLMKRGTPNLKELRDLKVDFGENCCPWLFHEPGGFEYVKDYLLQNSPHAKVTIMHEYSNDHPWGYIWD
ncbi:hypothetical protein LXL04_018657 [Taraxacum kok-saghyz]